MSESSSADNEPVFRDQRQSVVDLEQLAASLSPSSPSLGEKAGRVRSIVQHYPWSKISKRGLRMLGQKLQGNKVIGQPATGQATPELKSVDEIRQIADLLIHGYRKHPSHSRTSLQQGVVCLLNREFEIGNPVNWDLARDEAPSHLWYFHLHYHEYLLNIAASIDQPTVDEASLIEIETFIESWIDQFSPDSTPRTHDAWHPYCISRRVPAWICLLARLDLSAALRIKMLNSIVGQCSYMADNLERDIGGNHLMENLCTLAFAGCTIASDESDRWIRLSERLLRKQIEGQILKSGEHFEMAPTYHCQMLWIILRVAIAGASARPSLARLCHHAATKMISFASQILHPDGEVPLLSDSGFHEAPSINTLREASSIVNIPWSDPATGIGLVGHYHVFRDRHDEDFAIFDTGPVAPDSLPAHGHCDLLNLEISVAGKRWIVDSGNYNYEADSMRQYCRSSLAHNVVTVASQNQCDVWSKFRMGRRGRIVESCSGVFNDFGWAFAAHDGYRHLGLTRMNRVFAGDLQGHWICFDFLSESVERPVLGYLHFEPSINLCAFDDSQFKYLLSNDTEKRQIQFFGVLGVHEASGWYCPSFGEKSPAKVFVYEAPGDLSAFGWIIGPMDEELTVKAGESTLEVFANQTPIFDWKP